ncbi:MAG: hypothetical protein EOP11_01275 [Proteobacteria bacterium]|nr:MAG: hypothetical protein EOP11_01275 [Pseudomonadota bacterium]
MKSLLLLSLLLFSATANADNKEEQDRLLFDPTPLDQVKSSAPEKTTEKPAVKTEIPVETPKPQANPIRQITIDKAPVPGTVTPVETAEPAAKPAAEPAEKAPWNPGVVMKLPEGAGDAVSPRVSVTLTPETPLVPNLGGTGETPAPEVSVEKLPTGPITLYAAGNYRLRASRWGRVLMVIPKGKAFEILGKFKEFYLVRYNGKTGYIHRNGLDHPLAEAIKAEEGLGALKRFEAAEIAACLLQADAATISPDMKDFFQRVQASLDPYKDTDPKSEKAPPAVITTKPVKPNAEAPKSTPNVPAVPGVSGQNPGLTAGTSPLPPRRPVAGGPSLLPKAAPQAEYDANPDEDEIASIQKPDVLKRLSANSDNAAKACRRYAKFICKKRGLCGISCDPRRSKGMCKAGVREILQSTYAFHLPGGDAAASNEALKRSPKFTQIRGDDCSKAPQGAICVYDAKHHEFGHIEIKSGANKYCSDYCAVRPVSKRSYKVRAIYMPNFERLEKK